MRRLLALLAFVASPALAGERVLTVTSFDRIRIEGAMTVEIATGRGPSARISGSEAAMESVSIANQGQTLVVRPRSGWGGYGGDDPGPLTVRLTTPALRGLAMTGAGSVRVDAMRAAAVAIALEGGGVVTVGAIEADALDVGMAGAGSMTLAGRAAGARFAVRGTATLAADALAVRDAKIIAEGAGNVAVSASRTANVTSTGAGSVTVAGTPACTVVRRGSGSVSCKGPR